MPQSTKRGRRGRPPYMGAEAEQLLARLLASDPAEYGADSARWTQRWTAQALADIFCELGEPLSRRTIYRSARRLYGRQWWRKGRG